MGHNSVLKLGRSLLRTVLTHSTRGAKVVKKRIGKAFENQALGRWPNRVLEKSTSLVMLDERVASIVVEQHPYCPSQKPVDGKDLRVDVATHKPLTIPSPKRILSSSEEEEEDNDEVYIKRVRSLDYSSFSEQEFKEMVESFIQRFNHRIADEHYYFTHTHKNIVLAESP